MRVETIGNATLYCGDCMEILPTLPKVDAVVTDPPYGIDHSYHGGGFNHLTERHFERVKIHDDDKSFDSSPWLALNVPTLFWGGNYFADKLPISSGWLVWDKERPDELDQATCELAWTNFVKGVRRYRYLWNGMMRAGEKGHNFHPTQKPVALVEWTLNLKWTPRGTILDPFMGSGTTGVACANLGRKFIGIEIEPKYFDIACERIAAAYAQQRLFA